MSFVSLVTELSNGIYLWTKSELVGIGARQVGVVSENGWFPFLEGELEPIVWPPLFSFVIGNCVPDIY